MRLCKTLIHQISSQLNISCKCIRYTIYKLDKFHTVATKPCAGRTPKVTKRQKRLIKLQQAQDDTLSLTDLVRFARTDLNLTITRQTVSRILQDFLMISYIAPRKSRITPAQRHTRVPYCYEHLSWSVVVALSLSFCFRAGKKRKAFAFLSFTKGKLTAFLAFLSKKERKGNLKSFRSL